MNKIFFIILFSFTCIFANAQSPVGKWKCISKTSVYEGKTIDFHAALVKQRPCTANMIYDYRSDGKVITIINGCDESYTAIQGKLWKNLKWKMEGNSITTFVTDFSLGTSYTVAFSGSKMIWKNKEETVVYQKL